jgi:2-hydroxy-3-keto-5-methylthiopentenyl-1-phosphate phosphatase
VITSSGIDFYIKAILEKHDLGVVPFLANRGIWVKGLGLVIEEGMVNEDCDQCGNCKTMLVEQYQARGARVLFVGDGITDECAASKADMVFARRSLLEFCEKEGLLHMSFDTFNDIMQGLEASED